MFHSMKKACENGNLNEIKKLVLEGANIHEEDSIFSIIQYACYYGSLEIVKFLVSVGANIHEEDYTFLLACYNGHLETVKFIVSLGADIHADNDSGILLASENGHLETVKFLLLKGADVDMIAVDVDNIGMKRVVSLWKCLKKCRTISSILFLQRFIKYRAAISEVKFIPGIGINYFKAKHHYCL